MPLGNDVVLIVSGPATLTVINATGMLSPLAVIVTVPGPCEVSRTAIVVNSLPSG